MRIGYLLCDGDRVVGNSARCVGMNVNDWFIRQGIDSTIVWGHEPPGGLDIPRIPQLEQAISNEEFTHLIFQKVCLGYAEYYLELAKKYNVTTVYTADDYVVDDGSTRMCQKADIVVANSQYVQDWIIKNLKKPASYIPCAYESPKELCKQTYKTEKIRVFWFGSPANIQQAQDIKDVIEKLGYTYEILTGDPSVATILFTLTYYNQLVEADIVVIPCLNMGVFQKAKGVGRPVESMILGVPTVVSPIPSYVDLIENGVNGFVCHLNTKDQFQDYLEYLGDEKVREQIGRAGRERVIEKYHIEYIGKLWKGVLDGEVNTFILS